MPVLLAAIAVLAIGSMGCPRPVPKPRNVLLVSLDTVRGDRLGCYGRANAGTSNLDALAARGMLFSDALAPSPLTLPSHVSLMTGLDVERHRVRHNGLFALPPEATTLSEILQPAGLRSGAFVASAVLAPRQGLAQGFATYSFPEAAGDSGMFFLSDRTASAVNAEFLTWLSQAPDAPFFAWVHYMEAHAPYEPPEPERSRFVSDPYQGEIATMDRAFGELMAALKERGALDNTLVIVVADHGEDLGDHGEGTHGLFVYQSTLHVPFIVAGPGVQAGKVIDAPVGLVDVMPTLIDALGLAPLTPCDGLSLWPALSVGQPLDATRTLIAETFGPRYDYGWSELRALKSGSTKLIEAPRPELYSLASDPGERQDLAAAQPARVTELRTSLAAFIERMGREGMEPTKTDLTAEEREALGSLGYLSGAHSGAADAGQLADPKDKVRLAVALDEAGARLREGNPVAAETLLREILASDPEMIEARLRLHLALILQGRLDEALVEGAKLVESASQLPSGDRVAAKAHVMMGRIYLEKKQLPEAAAEWEKALAVPQPPLLRLMLAEVYRDLGKPQQGILLLRQAVAAGESSPQIEALLRSLESAAGGGR